MAEYLVREEKNSDWCEIAKHDSNGWSLWTSGLKHWVENSGTAFGIFCGFEDGLHLSKTEEEVKELIAKYEK